MLIQMLFTAVSLILTLLFFLYGFNHYFLLNAVRSYQTLNCDFRLPAIMITTIRKRPSSPRPAEQSPPVFWVVMNCAGG